MQIYIAKANGRGKCGMCSNPIGKGVLQMVIQGYQTSTRVHLACITKMVEEYYDTTSKKTVQEVQAETMARFSPQKRACEHCEGMFYESEMERVPIVQGMYEYYCPDCLEYADDVR